MKLKDVHKEDLFTEEIDLLRRYPEYETAKFISEPCQEDIANIVRGYLKKANTRKSPEAKKLIMDLMYDLEEYFEIVFSHMV